MIKSEYAKAYSKTIKPSILNSAYLDLIRIQNRCYNKNTVAAHVVKDAGRLFDAICDGDLGVIERMSHKYQKAYLVMRKTGQTQDRFIPVDLTKVRIFNISMKYTTDLAKYIERQKRGGRGTKEAIDRNRESDHQAQRQIYHNHQNGVTNL
jgi:hypothetical protein